MLIFDVVYVHLMRVLFVASGDRTRASSRFRVFELIPHLEDLDLSCYTISQPTSNSYISGRFQKLSFISKVLIQASISDVTYVQKVNFPPWFTAILSSVSQNLIYDFDDAIYLAPPGSTVDEANVHALQSLLRISDLVVAGSTPLAEYAEDYNHDIVNIPTGIPENTYKSHRKLPKTEGPLRLGWIGNPDNIYYLEEIEEELYKVLDENDEVELRIITSSDPPVRPLSDREGADVEYREWTLETALPDLAEADIGLRPLRNDEWTRSKGGFTSVIESMALGLPVVASPVGMLAEIIDDRHNGFLISNQDDWYSTLMDITTTNRSDLRKIGSNAVYTVSKYEFWSEDKARTINEVITKRFNTK